MPVPSQARGATQDVVRQHNLAAVLGHVHRHGPTSRADLTRTLGLNRSTIGALADELSSRGLLLERGVTGRGTPGRPSNVVDVRTDTVGVLAGVVEVDTLTVAVVSLGGRVLRRREVRLASETDRAPDRVLAAVCALSRELVVEAPDGLVPVAVGMAVPGVVRGRDGLVHFAPNLGWRDAPFGARLARRLASRVGLSIPVQCRNDAGLGAIAEHARGAGVGVANLVYLHADVGVGGGIIANGRLLEGAAGYSGEVGHMRVNPEGAPCRCGSRGCWETEVGADALVALAGRAPGGRAALDEVMSAAASGEAAARRAVKSIARWVGIGLGNIVSCINPEMVVLGGLFADVLNLAGPTVKLHMRSGSVSAAHAGVELALPRLGRESVLLGAAEVALDQVLRDPGRMPVLSGRQRACSRPSGPDPPARRGPVPGAAV